jgi:hypothetical protein
MDMKIGSVPAPLYHGFRRGTVKAVFALDESRPFLSLVRNARLNQSVWRHPSQREGDTSWASSSGKKYGNVSISYILGLVYLTRPVNTYGSAPRCITLEIRDLFYDKTGNYLATNDHRLRRGQVQKGETTCVRPLNSVPDATSGGYACWGKCPCAYF